MNIFSMFKWKKVACMDASYYNKTINQVTGEIVKDLVKGVFIIEKRLNKTRCYIETLNGNKDYVSTEYIKTHFPEVTKYFTN